MAMFVFSEGFTTTVQSQASAGATFMANIIMGAFQASTAATTPTGSRNDM